MGKFKIKSVRNLEEYILLSEILDTVINWCEGDYSIESENPCYIVTEFENMKETKETEKILLVKGGRFIGLFEVNDKNKTLELIKKGIKEKSYAYWSAFGTESFLKENDIECKLETESFVYDVKDGER